MNITDFITQAREFVGDGYTDNLARLESLNNPDLGGIIDGNNKNFVTENFPVQAVVSVQVDGATVTSPSGYTLNPDTGQITFVVAPTQSAIITYYYLLMPDDSWEQFVQDGIRRLNLSTGDLADDIQNVPEGLLAALNSYTCGSWARRIAGQSGLWYNQRLQERNEDRDSISKKFSTMSQDLLKDGDIARDDYYKGAGKQYKPGFTVIMHPPRQYTPSR